MQNRTDEKETIADEVLGDRVLGDVIVCTPAQSGLGDEGIIFTSFKCHSFQHGE